MADEEPKDSPATAYIKGHLGGLASILSSDRPDFAFLGATDADRERAKSANKGLLGLNSGKDEADRNASAGSLSPGWWLVKLALFPLVILWMIGGGVVTAQYTSQPLWILAGFLFSGPALLLLILLSTLAFRLFKYF